MHSKNYIVLIIFTSYLLVYLMLFYTDHKISEKLNTALHREEEDWKLLESLDPFKDIVTIKELARKKYSSRRDILQTTCDKIKGWVTV